VIKRNILYTPDASNILAGITRDSVIAIARDLGFKVIEKKFAPQFLRNADEIFLTGTGIQLQEVSEIKEYFLRKKAAAPVTKAISDHYKKAAYGENKKFFRWLTMA
jgi:branched-chain amino acid aminotransferase